MPPSSSKSLTSPYNGSPNQIVPSLFTTTSLVFKGFQMGIHQMHNTTVVLGAQQCPMAVTAGQQTTLKITRLSIRESSVVAEHTQAMTFTPRQNSIGMSETRRRC